MGLLLDGNQATCVLVQWLCVNAVQAAVWKGKVLWERARKLLACAAACLQV